jgi:iron(III) transport system ATP-binding protein
MTTVETDENKFFLEVRNVTKMFGSFVALEEISFGVRTGEFVTILGPSGCGKTTLLRVIAGLEEQNTGAIFLEARDISRLPTSKRNCGIVFQSYALFPNLTAEQNVAYGIRRRGKKKAEIKKRVREILELVGLGDSGHKYPAQMSGGQQQRVGLARALAPSPSLLLLDEPLSALDARVRVKLRQEIRQLQEQLGITTIMVTHDQEEALTMADRVAVINKGKLIQYGKPQEIYREPRNNFVAGFIGTMNFMNYCTVEDAETISYSGFTLKMANGSAKRYIGSEVTIAIRPEDIHVLQSNAIDEDNVLITEVEDYEFRGSFYRLRLKLWTDDAPEVKPQHLEVDLQADYLKSLGITEECRQASRPALLSVHLPAERLLIFDQPVDETTESSSES